MKYGLNQWARISSLLVRKTPKQCKARWFEWLDPSIVKTEWTRTEDEKLLHLAKLMPTQWRTIAPVVGRTPAQCLDRYERLLDRAAARAAAGGGDDGGDAAGTSSSAAPLYSRRDDPRRLRPGEIDPNPEAKPARPDAVDMDDEEKEMLSEARARLANTRGKKAKRKAREKALDEARRLAALQKQRELRAAGVEVREPKRQKRAIDYNAEVPFEHKPAAGFFDTTEEDEEAARRAEKFEAKSLDEVEGTAPGSSSRAAAQRLRAAKAAAKAAAAPLGVMDDGAGGVAGGPPRRRGKLMLPAPVVSDAELGLLVRGGGGAGELDDEEMEGAAGGSASTAALIQEYRAAANASSSLASRLPAPMRTPRVAGSSGGDRVLDEAAALAALVAGRTPLLGGEEVGGAGARARALASSDFSGATPRGGSSATPHALHHHRGEQHQTPSVHHRGGSMGPGATPLRDSLGLNEGGGGGGGVFARGRGGSASAKNPLLAGLASLPKPRNEYSVVVPDAPPTEEEEEEEREVLRGGGGKSKGGEERRVEDAEDAARRAAAAAARAEAAAEAARSQVLRRGLPRPRGASSLLAVSSTEDAYLDAAAALLDAELLSLLEHDAVTAPRGADGSSSSKSSRGRDGDSVVPKPPPAGWVAFSPSELDAARKALLEEAEKSSRVYSTEEVAEAAERERASWIVDVDAASSSADGGGKPSSGGLLVPSSSAPPALRASSLKAQFDAVRAEMERQAVRAARLDERSRALAAPFAAQGARAAATAAEAAARASAAARDEAAFTQLAERERGAAEGRIAAMRLRAEAQAEREAGLQARFSALVQERDALQKLLAKGKA